MIPERVGERLELTLRLTTNRRGKKIANIFDALMKQIDVLPLHQHRDQHLRTADGARARAAARVLLHPHIRASLLEHTTQGGLLPACARWQRSGQVGELRSSLAKLLSWYREVVSEIEKCKARLDAWASRPAHTAHGPRRIRIAAEGPIGALDAAHMKGPAGQCTRKTAKSACGWGCE